MTDENILEFKERDNSLTVLFYTSNYSKHRLVDEVKENLLNVIGEYPLISISQKPMDFGTNICVGDVGRSHLNIYRQILIGCKAAKTKYVGMAEDDILYSAEHFTEKRPERGHFLYDMNKWSIFTWTDPPMYSLRRRKVVNHLIAERQMLINALEERFDKYGCLEFGTDEVYIKQKKLGYWGDPGRYEKLLGVTERPTQEFYASKTGIVFSWPDAYGYTSRGIHKLLAKERTDWLPDWGSAADFMRRYYL